MPKVHKIYFNNPIKYSESQVKSKKMILILILISFVFSGVPAIAQNESSKTTGLKTSRFGNTDAITAEQMRNHLEFIASDELEGRDTPSKGLDIAGLYIAAHLKGWGIKPAGDNGTYFQRFPLKRLTLDAQSSYLELNGQKFLYGKDFHSQYVGGNISNAGIASRKSRLGCKIKKHKSV
jgi:hypothetical protein